MSDFAAGLIKNEPENVYHSRTEVSKSMLDSLARSPLHYWYFHVRAEKEPREATPAMALGSAVHLACLQPDLLDGAIAVAPKVDRRTKEGKATWEAFTIANGDKLILSAEQHATMTAVRDSVYRYAPARRLTFLRGESEITALWLDQTTEINCRGRIDKADFENGLLIDLKTTNDASPEAFTKSIFNYRYHVQAAYYLDGLEAAGIKGASQWPFVWVVVEKEPPYAVGVWAADETMIERGRWLYRRDLDRLKKCLDSEKWPSYRDDAETLRLPHWMLNDNILTVEI